MLNRNTKRKIVLATTCAALVVMTGCRSMPGAGMFGMRSEPSAEALAGSGPTLTYPAPPSASATPEAIASVAGGTAPPKNTNTRGTSESTTAQVAGFDVSPGYATQAANMAAAQANGIHSASGSKSAAIDGAAAEPAKLSNYAFGSKAFTPKADSSASSDNTYSLANSAAIASPSAPLTTPSTTGSQFAPPPLGSLASGSSATVTSQGFTFPTDSPALAAIAPPAPSPSPATLPSASPEPPAASAPDFTTASAATSYTAPSTTPSVLPPSLDAATLSAEGYMPGSTGNSSGYPTLSAEPTTSGSFYR
jgi:hypothetical protein